jgi:hypothetical protein
VRLRLKPKDWLGLSAVEQAVSVMSFRVRDARYGGTVDEIVFDVAFPRIENGARPSGRPLEETVRVTFDAPKRRARIHFESRIEHGDRVELDEVAREVCAALDAVTRKPTPPPFDASTLLRDLTALLADGLGASSQDAARYARLQRLLDEETRKQRNGQALMSYDAFWFIVDESRRRGEGDVRRTVEELEGRLIALPEAGIVAFRDVLARQLWLLDTELIACRGDEGPFRGSEEHFLFERCTAVLHGRSCCNAVLGDPTQLPLYERGAEELLYVPDDAHTKKTGRRIMVRPNVSPETRSNPDGWHADALRIEPPGSIAWRVRGGGFVKLRPPAAPTHVDSSADDNAFWPAIDEARRAARAPTPRATVRALRKVLSKRSPNEIVSFRDALARKLYELDTERIACRGKPPPFEGSGDGFLYERCGVIARGREFFERVVEDPSQLPDDGGIEELLYLADEVFAKKDDVEMPPPPVSFETCSNVAGWPR